MKFFSCVPDTHNTFVSLYNGVVRYFDVPDPLREDGEDPRAAPNPPSSPPTWREEKNDVEDEGKRRHRNGFRRGRGSSGDSTSSSFSSTSTATTSSFSSSSSSSSCSAILREVEASFSEERSRRGRAGKGRAKHHRSSTEKRPWGPSSPPLSSSGVPCQKTPPSTAFNLTKQERSDAHDLFPAWRLPPVFSSPRDALSTLRLPPHPILSASPFASSSSPLFSSSWSAPSTAPSTGWCFSCANPSVYRCKGRGGGGVGRMNDHETQQEAFLEEEEEDWRRREGPSRGTTRDSTRTCGPSSSSSSSGHLTTTPMIAIGGRRKQGGAGSGGGGRMSTFFTPSTPYSTSKTRAALRSPSSSDMTDAWYLQPASQRWEHTSQTSVEDRHSSVPPASPGLLAVLLIPTGELIYAPGCGYTSSCTSSSVRSRTGRENGTKMDASGVASYDEEFSSTTWRTPMSQDSTAVVSPTTKQEDAAVTTVTWMRDSEWVAVGDSQGWLWWYHVRCTPPPHGWTSVGRTTPTSFGSTRTTSQRRHHRSTASLEGEQEEGTRIYPVTREYQDGTSPHVQIVLRGAMRLGGERTEIEEQIEEAEEEMDDHSCGPSGSLDSRTPRCPHGEPPPPPPKRIKRRRMVPSTTSFLPLISSDHFPFNGHLAIASVAYLYVVSVRAAFSSSSFSSDSSSPFILAKIPLTVPTMTRPMTHGVSFPFPPPEEERESSHVVGATSSLAAGGGGHPSPRCTEEQRAFRGVSSSLVYSPTPIVSSCFIYCHPLHPLIGVALSVSSPPPSSSPFSSSFPYDCPYRSLREHTRGGWLFIIAWEKGHALPSSSPETTVPQWTTSTTTTTTPSERSSSFPCHLIKKTIHEWPPYPNESGNERLASPSSASLLSVECGAVHPKPQPEEETIISRSGKDISPPFQLRRIFQLYMDAAPRRTPHFYFSFSWMFSLELELALSNIMEGEVTILRLRRKTTQEKDLEASRRYPSSHFPRTITSIKHHAGFFSGTEACAADLVLDHMFSLPIPLASSSINVEYISYATAPLHDPPQLESGGPHDTRASMNLFPPGVGTGSPSSSMALGCSMAFPMIGNRVWRMMSRGETSEGVWWPPSCLFHASSSSSPMMASFDGSGRPAQQWKGEREGTFCSPTSSTAAASMWGTAWASCGVSPSHAFFSMPHHGEGATPDVRNEDGEDLVRRVPLREGAIAQSLWQWMHHKTQPPGWRVPHRSAILTRGSGGGGPRPGSQHPLGLPVVSSTPWAHRDPMTTTTMWEDGRSGGAGNEAAAICGGPMGWGAMEEDEQETDIEDVEEEEGEGVDDPEGQWKAGEDLLAYWLTQYGNGVEAAVADVEWSGLEPREGRHGGSPSRFFFHEPSQKPTSKHRHHTRSLCRLEKEEEEQEQERTCVASQRATDVSWEKPSSRWWRKGRKPRKRFQNQPAGRGGRGGAAILSSTAPISRGAGFSTAVVGMCEGAGVVIRVPVERVAHVTWWEGGKAGRPSRTTTSSSSLPRIEAGLFIAIGPSLYVVEGGGMEVKTAVNRSSCSTSSRRSNGSRGSRAPPSRSLYAIEQEFHEEEEEKVAEEEQRDVKVLLSYMETLETAGVIDYTCDVPGIWEYLLYWDESKQNSTPEKRTTSWNQRTPDDSVRWPSTHAHASKPEGLQKRNQECRDSSRPHPRQRRTSGARDRRPRSSSSSFSTSSSCPSSSSSNSSTLKKWKQETKAKKEEREEAHRRQVILSLLGWKRPDPHHPPRASTSSSSPDVTSSSTSSFDRGTLSSPSSSSTSSFSSSSSSWNEKVRHPKRRKQKRREQKEWWTCGAPPGPTMAPRSSAFRVSFDSNSSSSIPWCPRAAAMAALYGDFDTAIEWLSTSSSAATTTGAASSSSASLQEVVRYYLGHRTVLASVLVDSDPPSRLALLRQFPMWLLLCLLAACCVPLSSSSSTSSVVANRLKRRNTVDDRNGLLSPHEQRLWTRVETVTWKYRKEWIYENTSISLWDRLAIALLLEKRTPAFSSFSSSHHHVDDDEEEEERKDEDAMWDRSSEDTVPISSPPHRLHDLLHYFYQESNALQAWIIGYGISIASAPLVQMVVDETGDYALGACLLARIGVREGDVDCRQKPFAALWKSFHSTPVPPPSCASSSHEEGSQTALKEEVEEEEVEEEEEDPVASQYAILRGGTREQQRAARLARWRAKIRREEEKEKNEKKKMEEPPESGSTPAKSSTTPPLPPEDSTGPASSRLALASSSFSSSSVPLPSTTTLHASTCSVSPSWPVSLQKAMAWEVWRWWADAYRVSLLSQQSFIACAEFTVACRQLRATYASSLTSSMLPLGSHENNACSRREPLPRTRLLDGSVLDGKDRLWYPTTAGTEGCDDSFIAPFEMQKKGTIKEPQQRCGLHLPHRHLRRTLVPSHRQCSVCGKAVGHGWGAEKSHGLLVPSPPLPSSKHTFVQCCTCGHGGHLLHICAWFSSHRVCPEKGCLCCCNEG